MNYIDRVIEEVKQKDNSQPEFIQAVSEVFDSVGLFINKHPEYEAMAVLERLVEPERIITFRVSWEDDKGRVHVNRGYRVQSSAVLGPYKGGLRFHPSVNLSTMKFLAFEQVFKNALTTLPLGGGKGGSDFDPKGKSDSEIRRFCQSFMQELWRHMGADTDVPAGDMGVGAREIGYLYGEYRRLRNAAEKGAITGKAVNYGGSLGRTEATGYGLVYFLEEVLKRNDDCLQGKKILISGSGNVAIYAAEKAQQAGARIIAMSDSKGYILSADLKIDFIKEIKVKSKKSLQEYIELVGEGEYYKGSIYDTVLDYDIALPCATQNEIDLKRAENIKASNCFLVAEGANMPSNNDAIAYYRKKNIIYLPGKAANAGGVATSALEMSQNSMRLQWTFAEVEERLKAIMQAIHRQCEEVIDEYKLDKNDYKTAANIAGIKKLVEAMIAQGIY